MSLCHQELMVSGKSVLPVAALTIGVTRLCAPQLAPLMAYYYSLTIRKLTDYEFWSYSTGPDRARNMSGSTYQFLVENVKKPHCWYTDCHSRTSYRQLIRTAHTLPSGEDICWNECVWLCRGFAGAAPEGEGGWH